MTKLKTPATFETLFGTYEVTELIGEGGSGRVYGGKDLDGEPIALKVLSEDKASKEKRARFKNEIAFLMQNKHKNVITVLDHGLSVTGAIKGPFYVMPRYHGSLRGVITDRIKPEAVLPLFSQILDGVEAAHLKGVVHRDIKPENILINSDLKQLVVADFGIAKFTEDIVATMVVTSAGRRIGNFQYAAPEQRTPGQLMEIPADVYALGLILNELYTGTVPHGTDFKTIRGVSAELGFLDDIVAQMIRQQPRDRPGSIADVKVLIQRYQAEAVSLQRLNKIDNTVIPSGAIDDPSALEPPNLKGIDWDEGRLTLILDRPVSQAWAEMFKRPSWNYHLVMGKGPGSFSISGDRATVNARDFEIQQIVDYFKQWLSPVTSALKHSLERANREQEAERREKLRREREAEEKRLNLLQNIRI